MEEQNIKTQHLKILVVEDDETSQVVTQTLLGELGCIVDVAATGREAINLFAEKVYDLVLLDIAMLDIDGFTMINELRSIEVAKGFGNQVSFATISAYDDAGFRLRAEELGVLAYLLKPVSATDYLALFSRLFAKASCVSSDAIST